MSELRKSPSNLTLNIYIVTQLKCNVYTLLNKTLSSYLRPLVLLKILFSICLNLENYSSNY